MTAVQEWHIITCEYPPQLGGVSDYTRLVAKGLAEKGDRVHVWCPWNSEQSTPTSGIIIHRDLGKMNPGALREVGARLDKFPSPRRILVQWVPHGYGYRSMNLPFCLWLWNRARRSKDEVEIMVHEPFLAFGEGSWKQDAAAIIHRLMVTLILHAASKVWVSIPSWGDHLRPYLFGRRIPVKWLPVPSSVECDPSITNEVKSRYDDRTGHYTLGHFGTFGRPILEMLESLLPPLLLDHANRSFILIGRGSKEFRSTIIGRYPELNDSVIATGQITSDEVSTWIRKCDVMIQPYPDGVSGRRTTAMVGLSHGLPMVTTKGVLTEDVWTQDSGSALVPPGNTPLFLAAVDELLANDQTRSLMGCHAIRLYQNHFDVRHTIQSLRGALEPETAACEF